MTTTPTSPQAGDLILVQEPRWDPVAHAIRVTTGSIYSHAIVALGHDEFAECHTGDQVISAFRRNRFEHRIMTKYQRVTLFRPTHLVDADAALLTETRDRLLFHVHRLQGAEAWAQRVGGSDVLGRRVAFALADGIGRGIIQRRVARCANPDVASLASRAMARSAARGLRFARAIVISTSTRGRERVFCSEFAYTVLTWAGGDFIDVAFLRSRLLALFGENDAPRDSVPPPPHAPGAAPRFDDRPRDSFRGQTREKLRSAAGVLRYTGWTLRYLVRPVVPDPAALTVADFVTPADLETSGSFVAVGERRRGDIDWRPVDTECHGDASADADEHVPVPSPVAVVGAVSP
jgi:hypothetical protein